MSLFSCVGGDNGANNFTADPKEKTPMDNSGDAGGDSLSFESAGGQGGAGGTLADEPPIQEERFFREAPVRKTISFTNNQGQEIFAALFLPRGKPPFPGVLVLHGSGGLLDEPENGDLQLDPTLFDWDKAPFESQFERWSELLVEEGFVVLLPASFASRGYFDWNKSPPENLRKKDRLIFRTQDAVAAQTALCNHEEVVCKRTAALGFSDGGTTLLTTTSSQIENIDQLDDIVALPTKQDFRLAIAYYPGCFLHGLISIAPDDRYLPRMPLHVFHGNQDPLLEHCPRRDEQAANSSRAANIENPFHLNIFEPGVGHGFDSSPENNAEQIAKSQAQNQTLDLLRELFN